MSATKSRRSVWIAAGAAAVLVATVAIAYPFVTREDVDSEPLPNATPIESHTPPSWSPWEHTYLPGYDPDPGSFVLPAVDGSADITAALSLEDDAVQTDNVAGLSFDSTDLASDLWGSAESNLTIMLQELDRPIMRFGGNGVDRRMWWTSEDEPAPDWAEVTVTPDDLERVASVIETIDAQVTMVLDLGNDDPERAADMASHAEQAFGDRLIAVTVGNEPNGYHHPNQPQLTVRDEDWDTDAYQDALVEYADAIYDIAPDLQLAGPGAYDAPWWRAFAETELPQDAAALFYALVPTLGLRGPR